MCGVFGLLLDEEERFPAALAATCSNMLAHRGPDDEGWLIGCKSEIEFLRSVGTDVVADLIFLHRRLAIIDVSTDGRQPMSSADRRFSIIFNGEIYNYIELKRELERIGYGFTTKTDTEVLLTAYRAWGSGVLTRLVGMFAFAILDRATDEVFLARDPFGIKPLYYSKWNGGFAFCSEIGPLLELPPVSRAGHPQSYYEFLRSGLTDHKRDTMFRDVKQLPPASFMRIERGTSKILEETRYWRIKDTGQCKDSVDTAADTVRQMFDRNIKLHLRSDVPLGTALSGGIDSSSITCAAATNLADPGTLNCFSYIAEDTRLSEETWVDKVVAHAKTNCHKVFVRSEAVVQDLQDLISLQGEPFGGTGIFAQNRVFKAAKSAGMKVMLDGQGADEMLGGYGNYQGVRLASTLRSADWQALKGFIFRSPHQLSASKFAMLAFAWDDLTGGLGRDVFQNLAGRSFVRSGGSVSSWMDRRWVAGHVDPIPRERPEPGETRLHQRLREDVSLKGLPRLLRYEDRNSMHYSIESRVPFLTTEFASYVLSLPEHYLIDRNWMTKSIFRKAMKGLVPSEVLGRVDKLGFTSPERAWILTNRTWARQVLESETAHSLPGLKRQKIRDEFDAICSGRRPYNGRFWRILNVIEWARMFKVSL